MVVEISLNGIVLKFSKCNSLTFYNRLPETLALRITHSDVWTHLKKQIVILNGNDELQIDFENNSIIEIPKSLLKYPGVVIYCKGQNEVEEPTFYITSNYMVIGVDKYCQI